MNTPRFLLTLALCIAAPLMSQAQPSSMTPKSFPTVQGKTYTFERVADGVYYASGGLGSNHVVVVNDDDVLIVDTGRPLPRVPSSTISRRSRINRCAMS